jgi:hypothetical protein
MDEDNRHLQPGLFDSAAENVRIDEVIRCALGDFQQRGFDLAGRKLALDRLLGAFRRACDRFGLAPIEDSVLAARLSELGAVVEEVPQFVAKHPYRVTVPARLAESSRKYFEELAETESGLK